MYLRTSLTLIGSFSLNGKLRSVLMDVAEATLLFGRAATSQILTLAKPCWGALLQNQWFVCGFMSLIIKMVLQSGRFWNS